MKRRRRMRALDDLLSQLHSRDFDKREYALFQLGLILDRSNQGSEYDYAEHSLSRELLRLRLHGDVQALLAEQLYQFAIDSNKNRASIFWAMGKAEAGAMFRPLIALIDTVGAELDDEPAFQACRALCKCLESQAVFTDPFSERMQNSNLLSFLDRWSRGSDKRLEAIANRLIAAIERLDQ